MESDDDELWSQTEKLLRRRPGWAVQAVATPGIPAYWCFARGSKAELSVQVERGSINVQLGDTDQIFEMDHVSDLVEWLTAHRPGSLQEPRRSFTERLKAGTLFRWE